MYTRMENVSQRNQELYEKVSFEHQVHLEESGLQVTPFFFKQTLGDREIKALQEQIPPPDFCTDNDDSIPENDHFKYLVFSPDSRTSFDRAILLLHGLNERSWKKYLVWAEFLSVKTGIPVILFPIAFHMNRAPQSWINPHAVFQWVDRRKKEIRDLKNSTFFNIALSSRLSSNPIRFYTSGRESIYNIRQLVREMKEGKNPLFDKGATVDLFGYSIGALLSQVLLLANPDQLFSKSRLFTFCGGSIFCEINGNARDIIDSEANERLQNFYKYEFIAENRTPDPDDTITRAFKAMIRPDFLKEYREDFFEKIKRRIRAISLKKDFVVPTAGIFSALGKGAAEMVEELDFSYAYSHQCPFPVCRDRGDNESVDHAFSVIFNKAAHFYNNPDE